MMRRAVLLRSVQRLLAEGDEVIEAAFMWSRHRWMLPFAAGAFVAMLLIAELAGFEEWSSRIALGVASAAIAVTATTNYRALAKTRHGIMIFEASKIRQFAKRLIEVLPASVEITRVGGTLLATDWHIAGRTYTVPKSSERAIHHIAGC